MAWIDPFNSSSYPEKIDVNQKFIDELKGELDDETARKTLAEFLYYNLQFTTRILTGMILRPFQAVMIKGWFEKNFSLACWGRGLGKTNAYLPNTQLLVKEYGLISITDLFKNIVFDEERWQEIPELELWNGQTWQKTNKILIQPKKDCLTIKTRYGYYHTGSTNHLIKVWNAKSCKIEWKRYHNIKIGDYICVSRNKSNFEFSSTDEENSYFAGLMIGDGCFSEKTKSMSFTNMDDELLDFVNKTKYKITSIYNKSGKAKEIRFSCEATRTFLSDFDLKKSLSYDKVIPKNILSNRLNLKACLQGLYDTDGGCEKNGIVSYCTTSELMAKQVHNSLLLFGIVSKLKEKKTKSKFGKAYIVQISGHNIEKFEKEIGFRLSRKKNHEIFKSKKHNTNTDTIPGIKEYCQREIKSKYTKENGKLTHELNEEWRNNIRRKKNQKDLSYSSLESYIKFFERAGVSEQELLPLKELQYQNFFFDPVIEIKESIEDCIDFNVPNGEMYWSNGFISHNSTLVGIFAVLYAIFNPGTRILIVSSNFRSSRRILETLDTISRKKEGLLMKQCFASDLSRRNDIFQWLMKNGSSIVCLPLASGEGLRGQRANVLIIDEALLVSKQIIENVLQPFLAVKSTDQITEIAKIREIEDQLIKDGLMKESERQVFKSKNKMIMLSSASFYGEYLHEVYTNYLKKIQNIADPKDSVKKQLDKDGEDEVSHFVSQLSYEVMEILAPDILDKGILKEVQSGDIPQNVIDREYKAQFVQDSGGLFRMAKMKKCTIPDGQKPTIEIIGENDAEYILAIDPNVSGSEIADHFAMSVLKIITKPSGKKVGMLVHSYAACAVDLKDHIEYFLYILEHFNVVYIAVDASQGDNMDFINVCNESDIFKNKKINLSAIEAEFGKEDQSEIAKQIKQSYNLNQKRIVQKQVFHSAFQSAAVDHLQACIDFENIIFAGKSLAVDGLAGIMSEQDIGTIHKTHKQFAGEDKGNPIYEFIERQDYLIDLTKYECSLIVVNTSSLGSRSYELPSAFRKSKNINRPRRDNFSSLMLANWALKLFLESRELPDENTDNTFIPQLI